MKKELQTTREKVQAVLDRAESSIKTVWLSNNEFRKVCQTSTPSSHSVFWTIEDGQVIVCDWTGSECFVETFYFMEYALLYMVDQDISYELVVNLDKIQAQSFGLLK